MTCAPVPQNATTPGIWNPLPYFDTVQQDGQLENIQSARRTSTRPPDGTLPAVSWVIPSDAVSEHPPAPVSAGQTYVTGLDQRGHARPGLERRPRSSSPGTTGAASTTTSSPPQGRRQRLRPARPGLVISPYARKGYIDHQTLSFDAYLKFIEDDFLGRPAARPEDRTGGPIRVPTVRENVKILGNLARDFDFHQKPRRPLILKPR